MLKLNDKDPLNTPVQTRDGRKARIICVDRKCYKGRETILALVQGENDVEQCTPYFSNGNYFGDREGTGDLVNIPQKITLFVNIYKIGERKHYPGSILYDTPEAAEEAINNAEAYIATAKVEFEV